MMDDAAHLRQALEKPKPFFATRPVGKGAAFRVFPPLKQAEETE